jgi:hypothetical protein
MLDRDAIKRLILDSDYAAVRDHYWALTRAIHTAAGTTEPLTDALNITAWNLPLHHDSAAIFMARHLAHAGEDERAIRLGLADLGGVPAFPTDPDWVIWLARQVAGETT